MPAHTQEDILSLIPARKQETIVALVDARKIEVFRYSERALHRVHELRAHHTSEQPTHLGASPTPGFHTGTRGGTAHDRQQRGLQEGTLRMEREAVREILRLAGTEGMVLVAGTPQHRRELFKKLATTLSFGLLELDAVDIHATPAQIIDAVAQGCERLDEERLRAEVAAVIEDAGARGPAALGAETTRWALGQGRVRALYVTRGFIDRHPADAEADVRSALAQDAKVEMLPDSLAVALEAHDGIAARLRYRLV